MKKAEISKWQKFWERTYLWEESHKWKERILKCKCSCWNVEYVLIGSLLQWKSKSCWCKKTKHWITKSKFYNTYININQRCYNKNNKSYKDYWLKWIKNRRATFMDFYNDMYDSYNEHVKMYWEDETTIDRINSKDDYYKENCRRATHLEQSNNLSSNHSVIYKWKHYKTLASLCREYWILPTTLNMRIKRYWLTIEEAIEIPLQNKKNWFKKLKTKNANETEWNMIK